MALTPLPPQFRRPCSIKVVLVKSQRVGSCLSILACANHWSLPHSFAEPKGVKGNCERVDKKLSTINQKIMRDKLRPSSTFSFD